MGSMSRVRFKLDPHGPSLLSYRHEFGFIYYSIISVQFEIAFVG